MIPDPELGEWSELWRSEETSQADISLRAKRAIRRFRLWIYCEILVTLTMGGGFTIWAVQAHQKPVTALALWVWISLATAWIFRFISDWTDFSGTAVVTDSYVEILLRRLRSNLRAAQFGAVLFFAQLAVTSSWVFLEINRDGHVTLREYLALPANLIFALGTVVFVIWLARYRHRLLNEIAELKKLRPETPKTSREPDFLTTALNHFVERLRSLRLRGW